MKVPSTEDMNKAFGEKDDKYSVWTTQETMENKAIKVVMVPFIVSHDGAVDKDTTRRWKLSTQDIRVDWARMTQNVLRPT